MPAANFPAELLAWFDARRRILPWRDGTRDPYRTWVSEVMLQQTRVEAVVPYYERFLAAFPTVEALAGAGEEEVLKQWAGLGYYRRARMLHRAAGLVAESGQFPQDSAGWRELPGVGEYTAAAIASLAHAEPVPVVDGNVKRVAARVLGLELAADDPALHRSARAWGGELMAALPVDAEPGALNEALMELGATCCTPRAPQCDSCPVSAVCKARTSAAGAEAFPAPRRAVVWKEVELKLLLARRDDRWLLRRRSEGWNPGLWEPPSIDASVEPSAAWADWGYSATGFTAVGQCKHTITRHRIRAEVLLADAPDAPADAWQDPESLPLTALAKKAMRVVTRAVTSLVLLAATAVAQEPEPDSQPESGDVGYRRPSASVPWVDTAPRLDGLLNEDVWNQATRLDGFVQVRPIEGGPGEPGTEVLLMRTDTHLYLGFICWEPEPSKIVLQSRKRDARLDAEDQVGFALDTFHDRKNSYFFQVSAAGSRGDALIGENGKRFNKPWDGFWRAQTRVLGDRWIAEIEIPFATLSFGQQEAWGANFRRNRGVDRSTHQWASPRREVFIGNIREGGTLHGFGGIESGLGVEVKPYLKTRWSNDRFANESDLLGTGGGEVNWRITPQMTASLTVNTDFAETEVDERRVNLGRFPLFFPEKRDFFLEDSTLFQFGETTGFGGGSSNLVPFFSRRIGLLEGVEVPIDYGLRLAGRAGPMELGALGVHTGAADGGIAPEDDIFVLRPSVDVGNDVSVGALFTSGDPAASTDNTVAGGDVRWVTTDGLPGTLTVNAFALWSDDEGLDAEGLGGGLQADLRTGDWTVRTKFIATQDDFRPALGFIRRPGEMLYSGSLGWEPYLNGGTVRRLGFDFRPTLWTDLNGQRTSSDLRFGLIEVEFEGGDEWDLNLVIENDQPGEEFEVADGVTVSAGDYDWAKWSTSYEFASTRVWAGEIRLSGGNWYDGDLYSVDGSLDYRPSPLVRMRLEYQEDRGSLPGGDFVVRLERARLNYDFTTQWSWENLIQADNQSNSLGLQSRLRWLIEDGRELFVVFGSSWLELDDGSVVPEQQDLTVKLVYTTRF